MTLALLQTIIQSIASTLYWIGFAVGVRGAAGVRPWRWIVGSAIVLATWLIAVVLLGSDGFFRNDVVPPRVPATLIATLVVGYLALLSPAFRGIVGKIPQHWLIGIQTFRILGGVFLVRYVEGQLPGIFAIPAGVGDVLTGLLAPPVAYWWYARKPYARAAAIAWNLFGMTDLVNAVTIGFLTGGATGGIVFPIVLIPVYAVPRAFLVHSYSLLGLLRETSRAPDKAPDREPVAAVHGRPA